MIKVTRVTLGQPEIVETEVIKAPPDHLGLLDPQDPRDPMESLVSQVLMDELEPRQGNVPSCDTTVTQMCI